MTERPEPAVLWGRYDGGRVLFSDQTYFRGRKLQPRGFIPKSLFEAKGEKLVQLVEESAIRRGANVIAVTQGPGFSKRLIDSYLTFHTQEDPEQDRAIRIQDPRQEILTGKARARPSKHFEKYEPELTWGTYGFDSSQPKGKRFVIQVEDGERIPTSNLKEIGRLQQYRTQGRRTPQRSREEIETEAMRRYDDEYKDHLILVPQTAKGPGSKVILYRRPAE